MLTRQTLAWPFTLAVLLGLFACRAEKATRSESAAPAASEAAGDSSAHEPGAVLKLTAEQVLSAGIQLASAEERTQSTPIQATAKIEPSADGEARVGPRIAGRIVALRAQAGDPVRTGQILAVIDSPELGRARADFLAALAAADLARENADREKGLFDRQISAQREWREAEAQAVRARSEKDAAENRLHALGITDEELPRMRVGGHLGSTMSLASPIGGVVAARNATLGQMVEPKDTLFVVMDLRTVWLQVDVYEQDLAQVRAGQEARVVLKAVPGAAYSGVVDSLGAVVDERSRTVKVRVVLDNSGGTLKPGMFATVTIDGTAGDRRRGLYVPSAAVQRVDKGHVVFVARGEHTFEPRQVEVVRDGTEWTEVARGVEAGEQVVTAGSFALKSELKKDELGGEE
jgi:cobalt-zinc-cadmium efflux system membrane fusion protein